MNREHMTFVRVSDHGIGFVQRGRVQKYRHEILGVASMIVVLA